MVDYNARGYEQQKYNIYTRGEYAVRPDTQVNIGIPLAPYTGIDNSGTAFSTGLDTKVWVKPYSDGTSVEKALGVSPRNWFESGNTNNDRAGMAGDRAEFGFVIDGVLDMRYASGNSNRTTAGQWIAPHPSGYVMYKTGMAYLGYILEPGRVTGQFTRVKIEPKYSTEDYQ